MKTKQLDLTTCPLFKNILFFSIPLVFTNLLQNLFSMVDTSIVGLFAGSLALGQVGSTGQMVFFIVGLISGFGGGINVLVAYYIGRKDKKNLDSIVHTAAIVSLITGLILSIFGIIISKPVLLLIQTRPELLDGAALYYRIYMLSMPAAALYNYGNAVLSAQGKTKLPLIFLSIAGIVNLFLDLFFIIYLQMGVAGVAIATVISQYVSCILTLAAIIKGNDLIKLSFSKLKLDSPKAIEILKLGIPAGLQNSVFAAANLFIQSGINSFGSSMVAGHAACSNLEWLCYNIMGAFYTACATFIGQNYGANKKDRILKSFFVCLIYTISIAIFFGIVDFKFGKTLLSIFTKDSEVIEKGFMKLQVMALSFWLAPPMDCTIAANRGLGKTVVPSIIIFAGSCAFRILWIYTIFAHFHTITMLFALYPFSWLITAAAEIVYFVHIFKKLC